ncbi:hypothetical protein CBR_g935 [Chara braunii]|nr:hypothetical protein CBR_g935 [Chara braunii]|eukprot:GBG67814.1 hypothetical protein CBR_g935 [Chara braunii]
MASKFTGAGAWATAAEEEEEEAKKQAKLFPVPMAAVKGQDAEAAFPSLVDSVAGIKGKKKKDRNTVSLSEFTIGMRTGLGNRKFEPSSGLTTEEYLTLPKGPRDRTGEEEDPSRAGRGFNFYKGGGGGRGFGDEERGRGGFGGGYGDERGGMGDRRERAEDLPSRADESDNWGSSKKVVTASLSMPRESGRGGMFFSGGGGGDRYGEDSRVSDRDLPSRADEVDNWAATKKITSSQSFNLDRRSYGSRYEDDRRGVGPEPDGPSRADGDWGVRRPAPAMVTRSYDSFETADRWRPAATAPTRPEGAPPTERPKLNLLKRTVPPSSSSPALPKEGEAAAAAAAAPAAAPAPRPSKPNPFGNAKPREEVLMEKGQDWRKLDAELEHKDLRKSWDRPERPITPEGSTTGSGGSGAPSETAVAAAAPAAAPAAPAPTVPVKPKVKPNPFGDAKPREYVLEEKGQDWRKIEFELEHKGVDRMETEEEKKLREEIAALEIAVKEEKERGGGGGGGGVGPGGFEEKKENGFAPGSSDTPAARPPSSEGLGAKELLAKKQRDLETLTRALDDKVRFAQRAGGDRFGRGPRAAEDRPRSRGGSVEDRERPRSSYSDRERYDRYGDGRDKPGAFDAEREALGRGPSAASERSAPPAAGGPGTNPK